MENENKFNELIASLQSKIDNIAASVNNIEGERISRKQAEEAAAAQKAKEEHETQLKAAWEEEFKKKYGITAEAPITDNAGSKQTPEPNTSSADTVNPTKPANPVGLAPTIKVQETTTTYKTVDEIIAEQRAKRNNWQPRNYTWKGKPQIKYLKLILEEEKTRFTSLLSLIIRRNGGKRL